VIKTVVEGMLRLVWFNRLKNSARNCRPNRSVRRVFLNKEASKEASPGDVRMSRPAFP